MAGSTRAGKSSKHGPGENGSINEDKKSSTVI